jgi:hypothetical protein
MDAADSSLVPMMLAIQPEVSMSPEEPKVKASVETVAYYNMVLTEAIFQLLEEKGILKREEVKDRIEKIKAETTLSFQMIQ